MLRLLFLIIFSQILSGCGLVELKDRLLQSAVSYIPWSFEEAMGDQMLPGVLEPKMQIDDPQALAALSKLIQPVSSQIKQPSVTLHISRDEALNAFAIPGGHLIFNKGMLMAAETPEEVLGVAAHELAHASERHVMRSLVQNLSLLAVVNIFFGDLTGVSAILLNQAHLLITSGFSRAQEAAADQRGIDYLLAAKVNPRGMIQFFRRIQAETGKNPSGIEGFYSTHPLTEDRIAAIEARISALPDAERKALKPVSLDLKGLQSRLEAATP